MIFNSYTFVLFFLLVTAGYYSASSWYWRKALLLAASLLFYSAWNPPFVGVLLLSTIVAWFSAKAVHYSSRVLEKRAWLIVSLLLNLGLLAYFKYSQLLLDTFARCLSAVGIAYVPPELDIVLPVGISFFTFQTLSYTLDVFRGKEEPAKSFLDFALYVTFFPQLVAGPIVRSTDFLPQCHMPKGWDLGNFSYGLLLMLLGMFQKIVIADGLAAPVVEKVYDQMAAPNSGAAWIGTLAFAVQIFSDFAGYSTCAIGCALCFGFSLPRNFKAPYMAVGFSDFWQRWHISLSSWLRDYLYIPLGGSRGSTVKTYVNLFLTMLIGGLWHGASWTFAAWGALHGLLLIIERILKAMFGRFAWFAHPVVELPLALATFGAVCFTWVLFRANSFDSASRIMYAMLIPSTAGQGLDYRSVGIILFLVVMLLTIHYISRHAPVDTRLDRFPGWLIGVVAGVMLYFCLTIGGSDRAFIYFQF